MYLSEKQIKATIPIHLELHKISYKDRLLNLNLLPLTFDRELKRLSHFL